MKVLQQKAKAPYLSPRTMTLLNELGIECQHILKLLAQLEMTGLSRAQVEDVLGQLSAAVLHLHEHTRDLDATIDEDLGETRSSPLE
jgi:hypothetical protein